MKLLNRVLLDLTSTHGENIKPWPDGPTVRAVKKNTVSAEFAKVYPTKDTGLENAQEAARKALDRALESAVVRGLVGYRKLGDLQTAYVWLAQ
jgi:hypothetical protein